MDADPSARCKYEARAELCTSCFCGPLASTLDDGSIGFSTAVMILQTESSRRSTTTDDKCHPPTTVLQLDADGTNGALDTAADCDVLRDDAALDLCAIADQEIRGAQLAFDSAEDLRWTIAFDVADDRHAGADARGRSLVVGSGLAVACSTTEASSIARTGPNIGAWCVFDRLQ
jgi:hypothetical protein